MDRYTDTIDQLFAARLIEAAAEHPRAEALINMACDLDDCDMDYGADVPVPDRGVVRV